jgi:SAM-dependent methyltransferase
MNNFTIEQVRKYWDKVSDVYTKANDKVGYVHYQRFEKAIQFSKIKKGQTVLNIWSRTGSLIPYIRRKYKSISLYNAEVSPKFIAIAKNRFPKENFSRTDLEHLDNFGDEKFHTIISLETLEHTPNPSALLAEFHRILKTDGKLIMSTPPAGVEIFVRVWDLLFESHGEGPHRFLWPYEIKELLTNAGFKIIIFKRYIILPLGNDKLERASENILGKLFGKTFIANFGVRHFYVCTKT